MDMEEKVLTRLIWLSPEVAEVIAVILDAVKKLDGDWYVHKSLHLHLRKSKVTYIYYLRVDVMDVVQKIVTYIFCMRVTVIDMVVIQ